MKIHWEKRTGKHLTLNLEKRIKQFIVPKIPKFVTADMLTLSSLISSFLIILFGYLSQYNLLYLWGCSGAIILQLITDELDGPLARYRKTASNWGFYMDHILDFTFMCSMCLGYYFILDIYAIIIMIVSSIFMVHTFLIYGATGKFKPTYFGIGPIESRLIFVVLNINIIIIKIPLTKLILPYIIGAFTLALIYTIYKDQKHLK